jgi:CRP/FNR family cyclic AMP-dependent transcriptional regulator
MVDSRHSMRRAVDRRGPKPIHRSGHPEFVELVAEDPLLFLERGQRLFAEGDVPTCMYIVKTGQLQIRSGGVIYEDVGPGGIIGEMGVIETQELRSATVYALTDSELVEINDARFARLIARAPSFAIAVMRTLSRRLRAMDRRNSTP